MRNYKGNNTSCVYNIHPLKKTCLANATFFLLSLALGYSIEKLVVREEMDPDVFGAAIEIKVYNTNL